MRKSVTEKEVVQAVGQHSDGIDAQSLAKTLVGQGYREYDVQRAMQRAFDKGLLELGPKLRLIKARAKAA